jgi:hypothetical protein
MPAAFEYIGMPIKTASATDRQAPLAHHSGEESLRYVTMNKSADDNPQHDPDPHLSVYL